MLAVQHLLAAVYNIVKTPDEVILKGQHFRCDQYSVCVAFHVGQT